MLEIYGGGSAGMLDADATDRRGWRHIFVEQSGTSVVNNCDTPIKEYTVSFTGGDGKMGVD